MTWVSGGAAIALLAAVLETNGVASLVAGGGIAGLLITRVPVLWPVAALVGGSLAVLALGLVAVAIGCAAFGLPLLWLYLAAASAVYAYPGAGEGFDAIALAVLREAVSHWATPMGAVGVFACLALSIVRRGGTGES